MLVSIIIPIYNVAPYIEQCINSVMHQTYRKLEVLLVDDCGTDDSIIMVKRMLGSKEDTIIDNVHYKIIRHEHNRGLSAARNTGIDAATGDWLYFLDSDDWISENCIETLVGVALQEHGIDLAIANYEASNGTRAGGPLKLADGVYSQDLLDLYLNKQYYVPVWNKLIRSSFLKREKLYFEEGLIHEDDLWSFCAACVIKKIAITNVSTYHYLIRESSLDHIPDLRMHTKNYLKSNLLQVAFVLNYSSELRHNSKLFFWLERNRYERYQNARWQGLDDIVYELYRMIRSSEYWSFYELLILRSTIGMKMRFFHKYLPIYRGYIYYSQIINKFGF